MIADARGEANPRGLVCPKCGCHNFAVRNTVRQAGIIKRYRTCRACGRVLTTFEGPVGVARDVVETIEEQDCNEE